jgi:N-acetylglucosaminyl-diphospho-decaprenol L-rhamnosyltransferase
VVAIVVNYNAAEHLATCVKSLRANGVADVVVIDNGSTDDSQATARSEGVRWIRASGNLGYGRAANLGASTEEGRTATYLLVCNPDTELGDGAVPSLLACLAAEPDLGIVGPCLFNPDGSVYPSARTFPDLLDAMGHGLLGMVASTNRFTRRYRMLDWDHHDRARVDWISGACFVARRTAWDAVGGFDPAYFMYLEDVDLCWRLGRSGWGVGYEPAAQVTHVQGVSTNHHPYRMLAAHHLSMWRFAWRKTTGPRRAALPLIAIGLIARFAAATFSHRLGASGRSALPFPGGSTSDRAPQPLP